MITALYFTRGEEHLGTKKKNLSENQSKPKSARFLASPVLGEECLVFNCLNTTDSNYIRFESSLYSDLIISGK